MTNPKRPLGFATPANRMEDAFTSLIEALAKAKTNWQAARTVVLHSGLVIKEIVAQARKNKDTQTLYFGVIAQMELSNALALTMLGKELTEVHERLAKIEHAIRETRLAE